MHRLQITLARMTTKYGQAVIISTEKIHGGNFVYIFLYTSPTVPMTTNLTRTDTNKRARRTGHKLTDKNRQAVNV